MVEVVTIGETMVTFSPDQSGPLRYVHGFRKRLAGSESNVAIGLSRLGHSSGWISRVGDDEFGKFVIREVRAEGVDVSRVRTDPDYPTGIMFKEIREGNETKVYYYRKGSAASFMSPEDIDSEYLGSSKILHITGIIPALSASCLDTMWKAIFIAKEKGVLVSFDPNIRLKLWSRDKAVETLKKIIPYVDIISTGLDEASMLLGIHEPEKLIDSLLNLGVKYIALKMGAQGSWVSNADEKLKMDAFKIKNAVDPIGAGDAFDAGFLAGILENKPLAECGKLANAMGAFAVTTYGDIEGLPARDELDKFLNNIPQTYR